MAAGAVRHSRRRSRRAGAEEVIRRRHGLLSACTGGSALPRWDPARHLVHKVARPDKSAVPGGPVARLSRRAGRAMDAGRTAAEVRTAAHGDARVTSAKHPRPDDPTEHARQHHAAPPPPEEPREPSAEDGVTPRRPQPSPRRRRLHPQTSTRARGHLQPPSPPPPAESGFRRLPATAEAGYPPPPPPSGVAPRRRRPGGGLPAPAPAPQAAATRRRPRPQAATRPRPPPPSGGHPPTAPHSRAGTSRSDADGLVRLRDAGGPAAVPAVAPPRTTWPSSPW